MQQVSEDTNMPTIGDHILMALGQYRDEMPPEAVKAFQQIAAMRSKDHSIAVDDVERVATAMLAPLGYVGVKSLAEAESIWVGSNIDDAETGSLAYLCRSLARAAITAIGSQSIEGERG